MDFLPLNIVDCVFIHCWLVGGTYQTSLGCSASALAHTAAPNLALCCHLPPPPPCPPSHSRACSTPTPPTGPCPPTPLPCPKSTPIKSPPLHTHQNRIKTRPLVRNKKNFPYTAVQLSTQQPIPPPGLAKRDHFQLIQDCNTIT